MTFPTKFNNKPFDFADSADCANPTGIFYIMEQRQLRNGVGSSAVTYIASRTPFRTNMTGETRVRGWLGATTHGSCGTDRTAIGRFNIVARSGHGGFRFRELSDE